MFDFEWARAMVKAEQFSTGEEERALAFLESLEAIYSDHQRELRQGETYRQALAEEVERLKGEIEMMSRECERAVTEMERLTDEKAQLEQELAKYREQQP